MKTIEKLNPLKYKTLTQMCLFLTIIAVCLGDIVEIFGLKLSWICAGLTVAAFAFEILSKRYRFSLNSLNLKIIFCFFIFWLAYATVQMFLIDRNANALLFYRFLLINIFLVLMLILNAKSVNDVVFFNKALIIGYLINFCVVLWELHTGNHIAGIEADPRYVYGVFANVNDLCTLIAYGIFAMILNLLLTKRNIFLTIGSVLLCFAAVAFSFHIIILNESRAPLLSLLLLVLFWALFAVAVLLYRKNRIVFACYIAVVVAAPVVAAVVILSKYSITELISKYSNELYVMSDNLRVELAQKALAITSDSHFLGVGPGQSVQMIGVNVHNFFLEILSEYGIVIFAGIIYLLFVIFTAFRTKLPIWASSFLMAFIPFFAMVSISSSSCAKIKATWVILTLVALVVVYGGKYKENAPDASKQGKSDDEAF